MLDKRLSRVGTVLMYGGEIHVEGFEAEGAMCREVLALALLWAIGEMQRDLVELIAVPGGSHRVGVDLPPDVSSALGLPSPFEDDQTN